MEWKIYYNFQSEESAYYASRPGKDSKFEVTRKKFYSIERDEKPIEVEDYFLQFLPEPVQIKRQTESAWTNETSDSIIEKNMDEELSQVLNQKYSYEIRKEYSGFTMIVKSLIKSNRNSFPKSITSDELEELYLLIKEGGQVMTEGLRERILNSNRIAYVKYGNRIISCAIIKRPNEVYVKEILQKTGIVSNIKKNVERKLKEDSFTYIKEWYARLNPDKLLISVNELGYLVTDKEFRGKGLCKVLIHKLLEESFNRGYAIPTLWASTSNKSVQRILEFFNFKKFGKPYKGNITNEEIQYYCSISDEKLIELLES